MSYLTAFVKHNRNDKLSNELELPTSNNKTVLVSTSLKTTVSYTARQEQDRSLTELHSQLYIPGVLYRRDRESVCHQ